MKRQGKYLDKGLGNDIVLRHVGSNLVVVLMQNGNSNVRVCAGISGINASALFGRSELEIDVCLSEALEMLFFGSLVLD